MSTLYASFTDAGTAERAAGALIDHGAAMEDISIIANETYATARGEHEQARALSAEDSAKTGISTTTAADVAAGSVKGAAAGIGVGIIAALASVLVPGVGLVLGAGALATALAGAAGTVAAGAAAGGVVGWLKDQGLDEDHVTKYSNTFYEGGAILALSVPTRDITAVEAEGLLAKYGAVNVATYNSNKVLPGGVVEEKVPLVVDRPNIDPIMIGGAPVAPVAPVVPVVPSASVVQDPVTGATAVVPNAAVVAPAAPVVAETVISEPGVGNRVVTTTTSNGAMAVDPVTGVATRVMTDPVTGVTRTVVVDAETGEPMTGNVVETESVVDASGNVLVPPAVVPTNPTVVTDRDGPKLF